MACQVYTKKSCSQCTILKSLFKRIGKQFEAVEVQNMQQVIDENEDLEDEIFDIKSFPLVVENYKAFGFEKAYEMYNEPLLDPSMDRFTLYPVKYPELFNMYKKSRASFWQPEEIDFKDDNWDALSDNEKHFLSHILSFFAGADGVVMENLAENFSGEVQIPEARAFYAIQIGIEAIHNETYGLLLDKYIKDAKQKQQLQQGIETIPCVKKKAMWAMKWFGSRDNPAPFAHRLAAFACVEGIFFSGSFCAIFWLKKRNLLPGLTFSNELISRDEGLHTQFAVMLYHLMKNKMSDDEASAMILEAVSTEIEFITSSIPCNMIGMNSELMKQYIHYVADRLLIDLGHRPIWNEQCPFDFMENISLQGKTNFFEKRVGEYAKTHGSDENIFSMDAVF